MNRRTVALLLGSVIIIAGAGGAFILYAPIFTDVPHAADDEKEPFTFDLEGEFQLTGTVLTNGDGFVRLETAVTEDGERYEYYRMGNFTHEVYEPSTGERIYHRHTHSDRESGESKLDSLNSTQNKTVVDVERDSDKIRFLVVDDDPEVTTDTITMAEVVFLGALQNPVGYEADDTGDVYRPQTGWYEYPGGYLRVSEASGTVEVESDTNVITSADTTVRYAFVSSYREYLRDDQELDTIETTVDVRDDATVTRPEWVDEITENS